MEVVLYVLGLAATGLLVGALARLVLPGRDPMTLFQTMLVGVAGSLIAGLITYYAFDRDAGPGLLLSLLCAVAIVYAVRKLRERQLGPQATSRAAPSGFGTTQVHFMPGCLIGSLVISLVLTLLLNLLIRAF
jgi:uncharacterized membrane protein YeaQ/YmgE (transglycosylase-associated protein family)